MPDRIEVVEGDITKQRVDAIVNAPGPDLLEECRKLGGCPTGEARTTKGYRLPAQWVIRTVGPVWRGGNDREDDLLASCYRSSLALAKKHSVRTIAFPAISAGAHRFPLEEATRIAVTEVSNFLDQDASVRSDNE